MDLPVVIFDLDGTLSNAEHRLHFIKTEPKYWMDFYEASKNDTPIPSAVTIARSLARAGYDIHILSGRNEVVREDTIQWLVRNGIPCHRLLMRGKEDRRSDVDLKGGWIEEYGYTPGNVLCVFEDRARLVEFYRDMGFICHQVADGNY